MKKITKVLLALTVLMTANTMQSYSQTIKQFSGEVGKETLYGIVTGTEKYSFYVKDGKRLKHGTYTFTGNYQKPKGKDFYTLSISSAYKDGKLNGPCKATMTGNFFWSIMVVKNSKMTEKAFSGSAKSEFSANFVDNKLDGMLSMSIQDMKFESKDNKDQWPQIYSINIMFKQGRMVGQYDCYYAHDCLKANLETVKGQFDENGKLTGIWNFDYPSGGHKAQQLRFLNNVLVDNGLMSDEEIQLAEQYAREEISEKDKESKGFYTKTEKLFLNCYGALMGGRYKDENYYWIGQGKYCEKAWNYADVADFFGLEDIREIYHGEQYKASEFFETNEPITYTQVISIPLCSENDFKELCDRDDYVKPYYDENKFAYSLYVDGSTIYLSPAQYERYIAYKDSIIMSNTKDLEDLLSNQLNSNIAAEFFLKYKKAGKDLQALFNGELAEYKINNLEYYVNCVEQGLSSLNKLLEANSDHIAYNSDSSIVVVRKDINGIPLYIKKGAWKLDEVKDFKTFADNLQILYAANSSRLNAVSVKCKELYNHPDYDIYNNICGKISQRLIPNRDNTYATAVELINIWDKLATSLVQIKETDAKQQTLFSSKEAKFYSEDRAVLLYPHGNITKSEELSKYADNLANLVAIQKGYIKWFELRDKVKEQDATIRDSYQKKTLKAYDASFKTIIKNVSKVPHISDQASADAECAPLEQIYNDQVQFINFTTPDAKK